MIVFCDIDGVLADCEHRLHYQKEKNYEKFYSEEEMLKDGEMGDGIGLIKILNADLFARVIFVTGRPQRTEQTTRKWLEEHTFPYPLHKKEMLMRKNHDYRPSDVVKVEMIKEYLKGDDAGYIIFIDDDPKNVIAVEKAFPNIQGILFGTSRLDLK